MGLRKTAATEGAAFLANLLALVLPLVLLQLFGRVIPAENTATLAVLALVVAAAAVGEIVLRIAGAARSVARAEAFEVAATDRLTYRALYEAPRLTEGDSRIDRAARFETVERLRQFHAEDTRQSVFDLPFVLVHVGAFYLIAPGLVWAMAAVLAIVLLSDLGPGTAGGAGQGSCEPIRPVWPISCWTRSAGSKRSRRCRRNRRSTAGWMR